MCDIDNIKINYLKKDKYNKDIYVKNSINKFTYIDYETAHMFYESNLLLELPEEVYNNIMRMCFKNHVMKIPKHIKIINARVKHQTHFKYDAQHINNMIDDRRPKNGKLEKYLDEAQEAYDEAHIPNSILCHHESLEGLGKQKKTGILQKIINQRIMATSKY